MILRRFFLQSASAAAYIALATVGAPTPGFSQTMDQHNWGPVVVHFADLNKGNHFELLESFTAGITGTLDRVALPLYEDVIIPGGLYNSSATITILNSNLTVVPGGTTVVPARSISNISNATPNLPDVNAIFRAHVISGHLYYIAVQANRVVAPSVGGNGLVWFATADDYPRGDQYYSYRSGTKFQIGDNYDLEFRTYVTPTHAAAETLVAPTGGLAVPEPPTWGMMLVGFAGLAYAGYRASRKSASAASHSQIGV
jgi:hypothetical protein